MDPERLNTANSTSEFEPKIEVRKLTPEDDLGKAGDLIYQVDPYICPDFFGDAERAKKIGPVLFTDDGGLFDFNHTFVAEENGKLLGVCIFGDNKMAPWDLDGMKQRVEALGIEMPEHFDRANKDYMELVVNAARELPDGVVEIEWLATDSEARGKGVGGLLMDAVLALPQYHEQHLTVLADNPPALHLYEKKGFKIVSTQTGYPDDSVGTHNMIRKAE